MSSLIDKLRRPLGRLKRQLANETAAKRSFDGEDVFVVTYPRSGTAWILTMILDLMVQLNGIETDTKTPALTALRTWPEKTFSGEIPQELSLPFRLVKSHEAADITQNRVVYLFRLPEDALSSYYHFHIKQGGALRELAESMTPDAFALKFLPEWCEHVQAAIARKQAAPGAIFMAAYERLHEDAATVLTGASAFMDLPVTDRMTKRAASNHTFAKSRATEEEIAGEGHKFYYRKGKVGGAHDDFSAETLAEIEKIAHPIYQQALDLLDT